MLVCFWSGVVGVGGRVVAAGMVGLCVLLPRFAFGGAAARGAVAFASKR